MQNLMVKTGSRWKNLSDGNIVTATHLMDTGLICIAYIEGGRIVLGSIARDMLYENYEDISER